jgi:hypothetical protein
VIQDANVCANAEFGVKKHLEQLTARLCPLWADASGVISDRYKDFFIIKSISDQTWKVKFRVASSSGVVKKVPLFLRPLHENEEAQPG